MARVRLAQSLPASLPAIALAAAGLLAAAPRAHATIVERVVAVIGERPVLWTDLLRRAVAGRVQIRQQTRDANVVMVQEQEMYKELLERMIDDRLEEQQADRAHITVASEEIDRALSNIAAQAQAQQGRPVTVADVMAEIRRRGMSDQDFHDEIRRQILEGKLIELRVRPRVRVTEQDAHSTYTRWVDELKEQEPMDVRILALRILPQSTQGQVQARMTLAEELARRARSGEDFCQLVSQFSDDIPTRTTCGSHGPQPFATLLPAIQSAVRAMGAGEVSDPISVLIGQEQAILILMPMGKARVPPFAEVKDEMTQKALMDSLERAKKQWLQELRRNVYIDVRL